MIRIQGAAKASLFDDVVAHFASSLRTCVFGKWAGRNSAINKVLKGIGVNNGA